MDLQLRHLLFVILFFSSQLQGQNLPEEWAISDDGRMLIAGGANTDGFYASDEIREIELEFTQANWWELLDDNYDSGTDIIATCWIDGIQYDSVGVRFKGATSYFQNNTEKKSFNITLDYMIDGQDVDGYNTFNLNCGWRDNTSMREVLYNNIGHHYYMSLKANYANLTINGENWGPYQNVQQFDSDYIKEWYLSNDGTIWRAERLSGTGGGPGGPGGPNFGAGTSTLNYNGPDSTDYNTDYTLKRTEVDDPWAGLIDACEVLNNEPLTTLEEELSRVLDIDKTCWFLAHENIFSDDDGYIHKGGSDYYVYFEAETNRIIPMEYDGNSVLGSNNLTWDLFYRENDSDFPLLNRMLAVPAIRQRYLAHVRTILEEYFNSSYADAEIDQWLEMIDSAVQDDPKKFYNYNQFQNAITTLKQSIITRRNAILNDPEMTNIESLEIDDVSYVVQDIQWQSPGASDQVNVLARVSGSASTASVWLYYGEGLTGKFTKTEMFDDGQHNDGQALDGLFGGTIPEFSSGTYVRYYIEAIADDDASTASYEPKGAEHDVFLYQVQFDNATDSAVVINELMSNNDSVVADDFGEYDDWVELYNKSSEAVDLSDWSMSDNLGVPDKFIFPTGTVLEPNSYLVIWADEDEDQGGLHADFKLSSDGETLYLFNHLEEIVDVVIFPESENDLSYARIPNGIGPFEFQEPTIGENNDLVNTTLESEETTMLLVYPNPASDYINLEVSNIDSSNARLQIVNMMGEIVHSMTSGVQSRNVIPTANLNPGLYQLRLELDNSIATVKFIKI